MIKLTSKNLRWRSQIERLPSMAKSLFPILLMGASGTGKELITEEIHSHSKRSGQLIKVNCSALSESLIESELFGHKKGSYTGALDDRKGAFEAARGGTLFLDEIGDLPYPMQAKLLRALENKEIKPVGSDQVKRIDVRIIAATHQELPKMISEKKFRSDLFYRLNVINFPIPSLTNRMEDFEHLLFQFSREYKVNFSYEAINALKSHSWPGNIRELKNTVARASVLFDSSRITESEIPLIINTESGRPAGLPKGTLKEIEKTLILHTLKTHKGNQRKTAATLGLPKSTLNDRLKDYGINYAKYKPAPRTTSTKGLST